MGAGDYMAGIGPAGFDPSTSSQGVIPSSARAAALYELQTKSFPFDADGRLKGVHPVVQEVAILLGIPLGGIAAAPTRGLDLRKLKKASRESAQNVAVDVVRTALARPIADQDIEITLVEIDQTFPGRLLVRVTFKNLRDPGSNPTTLRVT